MKKIGLLCGRESLFPQRFLEEVNGRGAGVVAEIVKLGGTQMDESIPYAVIVDRISHEVPYYRTYVKHAFIEGAAIINNPFMWSADDKFFAASLANKLGIIHPRTLVLPNKDYVPDIVKSESLRNLIYPLDWQYIIDCVGLPCVLKDAHGGDWHGIYVCHTKEDLIRSYDSSGLLTMIVQEYIQWNQFVRCYCLGRHDALIVPYDPVHHCPIREQSDLHAEVQHRIIHDSLIITQALGYDINMLEWVVRDGVPYPIDMTNPVPDLDVGVLLQPHFDWIVKSAADLAIANACNDRQQINELRWAKWF